MSYDVKNTRIILMKKYGSADAKPVLNTSLKSTNLQENEIIKNENLASGEGEG